MTTFIKNRTPILWVLILVTTLVLTWLFPLSRLLIEVAFLLVSLALASLVVIAKNWESFQQGKLARGALVGHSLFDVFGIVLAMAAAGLLANSMAHIINAQVGGDLIRIAAVIVASLLIGIGIGLVIKRIRAYILATLHPGI